MNQYTPGPWKIVQESIDPEWHIVTAHGGRIMANVNIETGNAIDQANAAHIVHCVNTYPALLAALKALHQANAETFEGLPNYDALWDAAAKAIAQAEGKSL